MDERKEAAEEALAQAETLLGRGHMSDREFLESMARCDSLVDHTDNCGHCMQIVVNTMRDSPCGRVRLAK